MKQLKYTAEQFKKYEHKSIRFEDWDMGSKLETFSGRITPETIERINQLMRKTPKPMIFLSYKDLKDPAFIGWTRMEDVMEDILDLQTERNL